jgi:hypothetical protein
MSQAELLAQLQAAESELDPQFKALRGAMAALKTAVRLAADEQADALPMHKAQIKLEAAAAELENERLATAVTAFAAATQSALDNLAYDFAKDLRDAFAARGEEVEGRPPLLTVGLLSFKIEMAARKGQWFYGREPLTKPIPLSLTAIVKAYDQQVKRIIERKLDDSFVEELRKAWVDCKAKRKQTPPGGRVNIVEVHAQMTMNRQTARFHNAPSRATFKDYDRVLFIRDLALVRDQEEAPFKLGVATKSLAEQSNRSIWLPETAVNGQYYSDITFD